MCGVCEPPRFLGDSGRGGDFRRHPLDRDIMGDIMGHRHHRSGIRALYFNLLKTCMYMRYSVDVLCV